MVRQRCGETLTTGQFRFTPQMGKYEFSSWALHPASIIIFNTLFAGRDSVLAVASLHRIDQLLRIVADAVLENDFNIFHVRDMRCWIAFYDYEVCILSRGDRSDLVLLTHIGCAIQGGNLDRLQWRETGFHQEFNSALITETGNGGSIPRGVGTRQQQSSSSGECAFQLHVTFEERGRINFRRLFAGGVVAKVKIRLTRLR